MLEGFCRSGVRNVVRLDYCSDLNGYRVVVAAERLQQLQLLLWTSEVLTPSLRAVMHAASWWASLQRSTSVSNDRVMNMTAIRMMTALTVAILILIILTIIILIRYAMT